MIKIAIFHPTDPIGHVPGGIDSFIKGILKWAPNDLEYTLLGASSNPAERPVGRSMSVTLGSRQSLYLPIVPMRSSSSRGGIPLSIRYLFALHGYLRKDALKEFHILDFHRIEPALIFSGDKRPKNVTLHADYAELRDKKSDIMWRHWPWLYEQLEARAFRTLDRIYAVRRSAIDRYQATFPACVNKFVFTPTWVDTTVFSPAPSGEDRQHLRAQVLAKLGIASTARILVFVGRLDHQKDPLLLLNAFRRAASGVRKLHLLMIGDGILRPEVEATCRREDLQDQVSLLGVRSAREIAEFLRISDIFVLPSAYEGMPIAVLEALATGVPVVSTAVGEVPAVLRNGVNGQISRDRSPGSFADAVCAALDNLEVMRGGPCETAAAPYHPEKVLGAIYDNHRAQYHRINDRP